MIMTQSVAYDRRGLSDKYGQYSYIRCLIKCRLEMRQVIFKDSAGKDTMSKGILYTEKDVVLDDRITKDGEMYTIAHIYDVVDLFGNLNYKKVYLV